MFKIVLSDYTHNASTCLATLMRVCFLLKASLPPLYFHLVPSSYFHCLLDSSLWASLLKPQTHVFILPGWQQNISTVPVSISLRWGWVFPLLPATLCLSISECLFNSLASTYQEFSVLSEIRSFRHMFPRQVITSCAYLSIKPSWTPALSLHKPVPWKPETGEGENGRERKRGGGWSCPSRYWFMLTSNCFHNNVLRVSQRSGQSPGWAEGTRVAKPKRRVEALSHWWGKVEEGGWAGVERRVRQLLVMVDI